MKNEDYRYSVQRQEHHDEIIGEGNYINYKYRGYDPRVGRLDWAVDPLHSRYPHYTPYQFSGNKVIHMIELEGLEEILYSKTLAGIEVITKIEGDIVLGELLSNATSGLNCEDIVLITDGNTVMPIVHEKGSTNVLTGFILMEIKSIQNAETYYERKQNAKTKDEKKSIATYYNLGLLFDAAGFDLEAIIKASKNGGRVFLVNVTEVLTDPLNSGTSISKINYGRTYLHEVLYHLEGLINTTFISGAEDHKKAFNFNESTAQWYLENDGLTEENIADGYSPRYSHPDSFDSSLEQRLIEVFPIILPVKKAEPIEKL